MHGSHPTINHTRQPRRRMLRFTVVALLALAAGGCGPDRPGAPGAARETEAVARGNLPHLPPQRPADSVNAPMAYLGRSLHVNPGVAPAADVVPIVRDHGGVRVAYGRVIDGVHRDELTRYLDVEVETTPAPLKAFRLKRTVRVVEGATVEMMDHTVRAVQLINAALPPEGRLRFDDTPVPMEFVESLEVSCKGFVCERPGVPLGDILVQFAPAEVWLGPERAKEKPHVSGQTVLNGSTRNFDAGSLSSWAGRVWVDPVRATGERRLLVLVHELLHTLGRGHADAERFPASVMRPVSDSIRRGEILYPLDRAALLAAYRMLEPSATRGEIAQALGSWEDTSTHVAGELDGGGGDARFGVGLRNGLARPWASGSAPRTGVAENGSLSGRVTWSGRVLGFTREGEAAAGAAELTIRPDTLDGTLRLTALESWPGGQPPGAAGTGRPLREGNSTYRVVVHGNRFVADGGDAGQVTGAFFGEFHAGMGGVMERDGLVAGFGGRRSTPRRARQILAGPRPRPGSRRAGGGEPCVRRQMADPHAADRPPSGVAGVHRGPGDSHGGRALDGGPHEPPAGVVSRIDAGSLVDGGNGATLWGTSRAGMVEWVDTRDLKSRGPRPVPVQVRLPAPESRIQPSTRHPCS